MITVFCLLMLWGSAFVLFQFYVQPRLNSYKQEIEQQFQEQTGSILTVDSIQGFWRVLVPEFHLKGIKIEDEDPKNPPLLLQEVIVQPSWWSLFTLSPRFSYIQIRSPKLDIVRNKSNEWLLNGVLLSKPGSGKSTNSNKIFNLLLQQKHINISKTHISFEDQLQAWPKLVLSEGNLNYQHRFFRNQLNLDGSLYGVGKSFNLSTSWQGDDVDQWHSWQGTMDIGVFSQSQSNFAYYLGSLFKQANIEGAALGHLSFSEGALDKFSFNMNFNNIRITDYQNNQIHFPKLSAKAYINKKEKQHYQFGVEDVVLETEEGKSLQNGHLLGEIQLGEQGYGSLEMDKMNLTSLNPILKLIGAHQSPIIRELNIRGVVHDLTAKWQGDLSNPQDIQLSSSFTDLSWKSVQNIPGVDQISGVIRLDKDKGSIELQSDEAKLEIQSLYNKPFIIQKLKAQLDVQQAQDHIVVTVREFTAQSQAIKNLNVSGSYTHYLTKQTQDLSHVPEMNKKQEEQVDQLDLLVKADQVNAQNIRDFLPVFTKPRSKEWLTHAFVSGQLNDIEASIQGNPKLFPFVDGKGGHFSAKANIEQLNLLFAPEWPSIHQMVGQIHFANERLTIHGKSGTAEGLKLSNTTAIIYDLKDKDHMWMDIDGYINGSLAQFLAFSRKTPIVKWTKGFIEQVQGQGLAGMNLKLHMPLQHVRDTEAEASLKLTNNVISFNKNQSIPKLSGVNGVITFTETGAKSQGVTANVFGGQVLLTTKITPSQATEFALKGNINTQALLSFYWPEAPNVVKGNSNYQASFLLGNKKGFHQLNLKSDLNGTTFDLPVVEKELKPLNLKLDPKHEGWLLNAKFGLNNDFMAHLNQNGLTSAAIFIGAQTRPLSLNRKGIQLVAKQDEIDLGQWLSIIQTQDERFSHKKTTNKSVPLFFNLKANVLKFNDITLNKALLRGSLEPERFLKVNVQSDLISGQANLDLQQKNQLLDIHLRRLNLMLKKTSQTDTFVNMPKTNCFGIQNIPNMNVLVDHVYINQQDYGVLSFYGKHTDSTHYQITDILLKHPKTTVTGYINLLPVTEICSQASGQFKLESSDFGGWLSAQDLTKQLFGTKTTINANLYLPKIEQLSIENIHGELDVLMKNGRFSNVQPGFGRVLGLFDLGMLRKRMMLNFSDVFLPGFTFETIKATGTIKQGILNTSDLKIDAAGITGKMVGNLNLQKQNMALDLSVTSNLTHGIVDSILNTQNNLPKEQKEELTEEEIASLPKNGILTRRYRISGAWQDPKVKQY